MKRVFFSVFALALLLFGLPSAFAQQTCADSMSGGDGVYQVCEGAILKHEPTGLTITVKSVRQDQVHLFLSGATESNFLLHPASPRRVYAGKLNRVTFTFQSFEPGSVAKLFIESTPNNFYHCGDLYGSDGYFELCREDSVEHQPTGVTVQLTGLNQYYADFKLSGATVTSARVYRNRYRAIESNQGNTLLLSFDRASRVKAFVQLSTEESATDCHSDLGEDGVYTLCRQQTVEHSPSLVSATVMEVNHDYLHLQLTNADKTQVRVYLAKSTAVKSVNGSRVNFTYLRNRPEEGAELLIESVTYPKNQGQRHVYVHRCESEGDDLIVQYRASGEPVLLTSGMDGDRMFQFTCISNRGYEVEWETPSDLPSSELEAF
ncbi:hypothetical protein IPJ72_06350 [Candidatus Peregrinibacteria bacterium]|nr:MAG: hypothetical protein IPJ72_06350 [Candidatus Peregrinibacteria bacterium]